MALRGNERTGGGVVRRGFHRNGGFVRQGTILSPEEIDAMPISNRRSLISTGAIDVFPAGVAVGHELFPVHIGHARFDVVEGRRLNAEPLSRDEARALIERRGAAPKTDAAAA